MAASIIDFFLKPGNELEPGGRPAAPVSEDENEPSVTCPNCHRGVPQSQIWDNLYCCPRCGHPFRMMGAGGITELIACVKAVGTGILPPTLGLLEPESDLPFVAETAQRERVCAAMALAIARARQQNKKDWSGKHKLKEK